jgi:oligopeptide/dipeptide ABC transporter ATP-binding protein
MSARLPGRSFRQTRALLGTLNGRIGLAGLAVLVFLAVAGPAIWGDAAEQVDTRVILQGPSDAHVLGTDALGRDLLARTLVATRPSLWYAVLTTALAASVGVTLGALPVVLGRRTSRVVTGAINMMIAFPGLLLAIFFAAVVGVGAGGAILALGIAGAPVVARLTNTLASGVAGSDFVAAARILGISRARLLARHVLPNIAEPLLLIITVSIGAVLLAFSGLSFLGLGVQPPYYDWGRLLNDGLARIYITPSAALTPGVAVVLAGIVFSLLGEGLAQVTSARSGLPTWAPGDEAFGPADAVDPPGRNGSRPPAGAVLEVADLHVSFPSARGAVLAVRGVSFDIGSGEIVGIVGESGSGKSVTAMAVAQLVGAHGDVRAARLTFGGHDLLRLSPEECRRMIGASLPMVFQSPGATLNPALRLGRQLSEVAEVHRGLTRANAADEATRRLKDVAMPGYVRRLRSYPHELSGGMKQRAVIAMGLMGAPRLLIADEPTTALDVTVQSQIVALLRTVSTESGAAVLLISHDISVVSELCGRVIVMYAGRIVEQADVARIAAGPAHPYTRALVAAVPTMTTDRGRPLATIPGRPPDPADVGPGCAFAPRCPHADEMCRAEPPPTVALADGWHVECWHPQVGVDVRPMAKAES